MDDLCSALRGCERAAGRQESSSAKSRARCSGARLRGTCGTRLSLRRMTILVQGLAKDVSDHGAWPPNVGGRRVEPSDWPFCASGLRSLIEGLLMVMGRGPRPPGWAVRYRLVVLTLAATPPARSLAAARGVRPVRRRRRSPHWRRRRERPRAGLHGQAQCAAVKDAVDYGQRPRRWSGTDIKAGWTLRPERRRAGCRGRSPADLRLRLAGGVLVPFLRCRWSHVGAKRRVGMCE